jgi:hypothetical protein
MLDRRCHAVSVGPCFFMPAPDSSVFGQNSNSISDLLVTRPRLLSRCAREPSAWFQMYDMWNRPDPVCVLVRQAPRRPYRLAC